MKLLMVSGDRNLAASKVGAFSETLQELSKHFTRIDILCPRVIAIQQVRVLYDNVFVHPAPFGLWYQPLWILKKGRELFSVHHHDVMTVHDYPPFYNGIGARLLKRYTKIPVALEIHHIVGFPRASSFGEYVGRILSRYFLSSHAKSFNRVRAVNETVKETLISWGMPREKISVVPSVYLDHTLVSAVRSTPKKFDLVFAARLSPNKGLLPVLDALATMPHTSLLVIGDGSIKHDSMLRAQSLGIAHRVHFAGWLQSARDVLAGIASGRLFIMNSRSEGNPRVAVEALALGVPVLATRVGIMPDVIAEGMNGAFIDGTAIDIAAKASLVLGDEKKLRSMAQEATKISGHFEKIAGIKTYADFLKSLALS